MNYHHTPDNGLNAIGLAPFVHHQTGGAPTGDAVLYKKRTLTTEEFRLHLGISQKTVTLWIRQGRLRVVKGLRPYAIPASELERVLKGGFIHE